MSKLPPISAPRHKVCIICEGFEDHAYLSRLLQLGVWDPAYQITPINAKSASNIVPRYQDAYTNGSYEIILVFCDTDKAPYREYEQIKKKLCAFHGGGKAVADKVVIFANPCTMQIILSHFGDVNLRNQGKKTNRETVRALTGIENYDAHEKQIKELCDMIFRKNYTDMKKRVSTMHFSDTVSGSTNFIIYLDRFEKNDVKWIREINKYLSSRPE